MKLLIGSLLFLSACNLPCPPCANSPTPSPTPVIITLPSSSPVASASPVPTATPIVVSTPAKCPCLVVWGVNPHIYLNGNQQMVDKPEQNGYIVFDTTPRFERFPGDTRGGPCNSEHDSCGGRHCENEDGPDFTVSGPALWRKLPGNSYQMKLGPMSAGHYKIIASPPSDFHDQEGLPEKACGPNASGVYEFSL